MAVGSEAGDGEVDVVGVPEHDAVEDEAERAELVLHAFVVALVELALLAVEDLLGEGVAAFLEVPDAFDLASVGFVVEDSEHVECLEDPPVRGDCFAERSGVAVALEHAHNVVGAHGPGVDRGDYSGDVGPVASDPFQ